MRGLTLILMAALLVPAGALADSVRCGSSLVVDGDTKYEVLSKCGTPVLIDVVSGPYQWKTEVWTYDAGPNRLLRLLTFRGATLQKIETIEYR